MRLDRDSFDTRLRALKDSNWEDCVPLRWAAQFALGAIPGLLVVVAILHLAESSASQHRKHGVSTASIVPLLSASALADHPTFHRLAAARTVALPEAQFRLPDASATTRGTKRVLHVTKRSSPLPVNFKAPPQNWTLLDASTRQQIDAGQPAVRGWQSVVLHGSGSIRGNAGLFDRYQSMVKGKTEGAGYHFVIGNGQGAADGRIEVTDRWRNALQNQEHEHDANHGHGISICMVGDFQQQQPTQAQLEALDELLDYLGMKLGVIPVTAHCSESGETSRCLGPKFPLDQILQATSSESLTTAEAKVEP